MLQTANQKLKKQTRPVKKIAKVSNSLRFRCRQRHLLWKAARLYLRVDATTQLRTKSNPPTNLRSIVTKVPSRPR